jgi:hypothetical protein
MLEGAAFSVHFIGGADPPALQTIETAMRFCPGSTIVYRPFGVSETRAEETWLGEFEQRLGMDASGRYQRIEGKNEQELFMVLERELARVRVPAPQSSPPDVAVSVICDEPDLEFAHFLRQEIETRDGLSVACPDFLIARATPMERMRNWTKLVRAGKAFLFCWGLAKDTSLLDHIYTLASQTKPGAARQWYLSGPDLEWKQQRYADAIAQEYEFHYDALNRFLRPLRGLPA